LLSFSGILPANSTLLRAAYEKVGKIKVKF